MTEARYRGQKVVVVSPDYAGHTKFADHWMTAEPGTDGALALAMAHVILKEFYVEKQTPYFDGYAKKHTDLPFLVTLRERDGAYVADRFLRATRHRRGRRENAEWKTVVLDEATGEPAVPNGSIGHRWGEEGAGHWNLAARRHRTAALAARRPRRARRARPAALRHRRDRGRRDHAPRRARRSGSATGSSRRCSTCSARSSASAATGLPGDWPTGYDDPEPGTPAWQEEHTSVDSGLRHPDRPRVRPQRGGHRGPLDDRHGRRHEPLVPRRPDLPRHAQHAAALRLPGRQRRRLGALRRAGEGPPDHRLRRRGVRAPTGPARRASRRRRRSGTWRPTSGATSASASTS